LTRGHFWTEKEMAVFAAQARYFMRIKGTDKYEDLMQFLTAFYEQLNQ
jgi:hypothetical protein